MAKRIILILIIALVVSIPVAFLMDSIFSSMSSVLSGTIGFALVSVFTSILLIRHEKIKPKSLTTKILVFSGAMIAYIIISWLIFIAFLVFVFFMGMSIG